jgi:transcriptional antiterminator RfaH
MLMPARWYVLCSKPRREAALTRYAQSRGHKVFYPTIPLRPVNPRASKVGPYFPGYVFLRATLSDISESSFRWMPHSQGLVQIGGEPAAVPDPMVRDLRRHIERIWEEGEIPGPQLSRGEPVTVLEGAFAGYEGIFDCSLPGGDRVRVLLKMVSERYVPVQLDVSLIQLGAAS